MKTCIANLLLPPQLMVWLVLVLAAPLRAQTFNQIHFLITTGGDDLRGDSTAGAILFGPNGATLQIVPLKNQQEAGWLPNSPHTVTASLAPPRRAQDIGYIYISCTSHSAPLETGDAWAVQGVIVILSNGGAGPTLWANAFGNPLQKLTADLPVLVLDSPNCLVNVLGPQPGTGRLRGFVDLHTNPLANLGFGGKLLYGGVDVGSLLPADPDCNKNVRAQSMVQALGHDASTHGSPIGCGDVIRAQVIHALQTGNGAKDEWYSEMEEPFSEFSGFSAG